MKANDDNSTPFGIDLEDLTDIRTAMFAAAQVLSEARQKAASIQGEMDACRQTTNTQQSALKEEVVILGAKVTGLRGEVGSLPAKLAAAVSAEKGQFLDELQTETSEAKRYAVEINAELAAQHFRLFTVPLIVSAAAVALALMAIWLVVKG